MVISSIDLMDGKAVQLKQGREKILENNHPLALAEEFNRYGKIAVIDLDAAMEKGNNRKLIQEILKTSECRVGGGIREPHQALKLISEGAEKVIIGSKAFNNNKVNHSFLKKMKKCIGSKKMIIAVDSLNKFIMTHGWKQKTGLNVFKTLPELEDYAEEFLFTCVEKEGTMQGIDMASVRKLRNLTDKKITAAGGICSLDEIKKLASMDVDAQIGRSLYSGEIDLADAFIESLNWKQELLPTITEDTSGQVLMLAYSNKNSITEAFQRRKMCYHSRSRNKLWIKGEQSGNFQHLVKMRADCDRDAILATVKQEGTACHTGSYSCFGDRKFNLSVLLKIIESRLANPAPDSYTAGLDTEKLNQKILEEAKEVIEAESSREITWEIADIMYFLMVLLKKRGISISSIFQELRRRHEIKTGNKRCN